MTDADRELLGRADAVAARACSSYSQFNVGAAARAKAGRWSRGVNVENASYSGVCAERTALTRTVVEGYRPGDLEAIAIIASPYGGCRQWLVEFRIPRVIYRTARASRSCAPGRAPADSFVL